MTTWRSWPQTREAEATQGYSEAMPPGGFFGRALVVDLDDVGSAVLPLDDALLRATLGGVGLGTHLISELAPPGVEPRFTV